MKVLAGDLGGTKALFGIAEIQSGQPPLFLHTCRLASADFPGVEPVLARYLAEAGEAALGLDAACLAVAGPVSPDGREARFTNLPWRVSAAALAASCGAPLRLVNDFAAVAAGVDASPPAERLVLQAGLADPDGLRLVIGAGTGLGVAALRGAGARLDILPGEGGHIAFAPQDAIQDRVLAALRAEHGRVSVERVVSGPGLAAIHRILAGEAREPAEIAERAMAGEAAARATTDCFFAAYGAVAGDLAMAFLSRGGICLAGGVTQRLLPLMPASPFLAAFNAKAEHAALVERMPVSVFTNPDIGLVGAAVLAGLSIC